LSDGKQRTDLLQVQTKSYIILWLFMYF